MPLAYALINIQTTFENMDELQQKVHWGLEGYIHGENVCCLNLHIHNIHNRLELKILCRNY